MSQPKPPTTPTEVLMKAMEDFGESEPVNLMVLFTNQSGDVIWRTSSMTTTNKVGLLECVKNWIMREAK